MSKKIVYSTVVGSYPQPNWLVNRELLKDETVNLVIQINGKKRDILSVKKDINENELLKMVDI